MQRAIRLSPGRLRSSENNEYVNSVMRMERMEIEVSTKLRYDSNSSSPKRIGFLQKRVYNMYRVSNQSCYNFISTANEFLKPH